jgi:hypothetical protein
VTFVKGYFRGAKYHPAYITKTEEFYPDLGDMLAGALEAVFLSEPLDTPQFNDLSRDAKQRLREV